jgi:RHS repeat-associated protein
VNNLFDTYPYERWIPTVTYVVYGPEGAGCSSLAPPAVTQRLLGMNATSGYSADPVNTGTGNFVLDEVDMSVVAGPSFGRTYNSMDDYLVADPASGRSSIVGHGWVSSLDLSLRPVDPADSDTDLVLRGEGGSRLVLESDELGGWATPEDLWADVAAATTDLGSVRQVSFADGRVWSFDLDGRLLRIEDGRGSRWSVARNVTTMFPETVTKETLAGSTWVPGPQLTLTDSTADGLVDLIQDPSGARVRYGYDAGRLVEVSVPYFASKYPGGDPPAAVEYLYDDAGRIEEVHRAGGLGGPVIEEVINTYDEFGRVEVQEMPSGEVATFSYGALDSGTNTRTTTVVHSWPDELTTADETVQYVHDANAQLIRVIDSQAGQVNTSWSDGLPLSHVGRSGAEYGYAFDASGRMVQRAIPDPETGLVGSRTGGATSLFSTPGSSAGWGLEEFEYCDAVAGDSRLLSATDATGVVTEYRYDPDGATSDPCPVGANTPTVVTVAPGTADEMVTLIEPGSDGRVRSVVDGDGVTVEYEYGNEGGGGCAVWQLCAMTVAPGTADEMRTENSYDSAGRLFSTIQGAGTADAATTTYAYNAAGDLVSATGPLVGVVAGHYPTEYRYDLAGRLVCVSDASNATTAANCDATNASWFYEYDNAGRQITEQDPDGNVTETDYVTAEETTITTGAGTSEAASTSVISGVMGRRIASVDPAGVASQWCYDLDGNVVAEFRGLELDGAGDPVLVNCAGTGPSAVLEVVREYDRLGRVVSEVDDRGVTAEYRYDLAGRVTHRISAAGTAEEAVAEYRYDDAGRLETELSPPPNTASFDWWDTGNDAAKLAVVNAYTPGGRLASLTAPNPNLPVVDEDPELEGLLWADTVTTTFGYDDAGRRVAVASPLAALDPNDDHGPAVTEYDALGRVKREISPAGRDVEYTYDLAGNVLHVDAPAGDDDRIVRSFVHDPLGRTVAESAPHASVADDPGTLAWTLYAYSPGGNLATVWDANDYRTDYTYTPTGSRTAQVTYATADPGRLADPSSLGVARYERWEHDPAGRVVATWLEDPADLGPRLQETTIDYTHPTTGVDDGRPYLVTDATGRTTTYTYDTGLLASVGFDDGVTDFSIAHTYDDAGRLVSSVDSREPTQPLERSYDVVDNLVSLDNNVDDPDNWLWGTSGNVMHRDGAFTEDYYYDLDGRMVESWAQSGYLVLNIGTWTYDPDGLLVDDTYLEAHWASIAEEPITYLGRHYDRDDGGEVTGYVQAAVEFLTGDWQHYMVTDLNYDETGRLSYEHEAMYLPDENGNGQVVSHREEDYTYDPGGQLTTVYYNLTEATVASWTYGPAGRRASHTTSAGTTTYDWNSLGQLTAATPASGPATTYSYDAAGRRTTQTDGTLTTTYKWDPAGDLVGRDHTDDVAEEDLWSETRAYDPGGSLTEITTVDHDANTETSDRLIWDKTWTFPKLRSWTHTPDGAAPIDYEFAQGPTGAPRIDDKVGNIWLTDARGTLIDFWGQTQPHTIAGETTYDWWGAPTDNTNQEVWLGYRGELTARDGLIHLQHRDYDPGTGGFLSPDPLDAVAGSSTLATTYHYSNNDPLNEVDPLGLRPMDDPDFGLSAFMDMCVNVDPVWDWPPWKDDPNCSSYYTELTNMTKAELLDAAIGILQWSARVGAEASMNLHRTPSPVADGLGLVKAAQAFLRGGDPEACGLSPVRSLPVLCINDAGPLLDSSQAGLTLGHVIFCATTCGDTFDSSVNMTWNVRTHEMVHVGQFEEFGDALLALSKLEDQRVAAMGLGGKASLCEHRYERPAYDADGRGALC